MGKKQCEHKRWKTILKVKGKRLIVECKNCSLTKDLKTGEVAEKGILYTGSISNLTSIDHKAEGT